MVQPTRSRTVRAESWSLGRNPTAGLAAIRSAKSSGSWVEISTMCGLRSGRVLDESVGDVEAALVSEVEVDESDVRPQSVWATNLQSEGKGVCSGW
jgi:hypothetical protein